MPADFDQDLWSSQIPALGVVNIEGTPVLVGHTLEEKNMKNRVFFFILGQDNTLELLKTEDMAAVKCYSMYVQ